MCVHMSVQCFASVRKFSSFWPQLILISKTNQFRKLIYVGCFLFNFVDAKKDAVT